MIVLAAGQGTRMRSERPKVAFEVCGRSLLGHVVDTVRRLGATRTVVVVGHGREIVEKIVADAPRVETAFQSRRRGTADAVKTAMRSLRDFDGTVLVLCGDVPLVRRETLRALLTHHRRRGAAATVLTATLDDAGGYGRILRDANHGFRAIREARDCTAAERAVREINSGIMAFDAAHLRSALRAVRADNAQSEYYLTDVPGILLRRSLRVDAVDRGTPDDLLGVNTFEQLAEVATRMRGRILAEHMGRGVEVTDPASTFIDVDVEIGAGTRVLPCTVIERGVRIGSGCEVGPFSHLRPGTVMEDGAEVGNFVETKKARIGARSKAKHLTYLGDTEIGADVNIGCGTITANYDGRNKHLTRIADRVHIGSGTVLVAPVSVGADATTGAGAIVTAGRDVAPGDVVVGVPARSLGGGKPRTRSGSGSHRRGR